MKKQRKAPEPKEAFIERMEEIFSNEKDLKEYLEILKQPPVKSIRCNKIKIKPNQLKIKLEEKGWKINQPFKDYSEVMIIEGKFEGRLNVKENLVSLQPGQLGRSLEHLLGYYYVQEIASMLPIIALKPKENQLILDLCASPGSKTTQIASEMNNTGTIIANEVSLGRIKILAANLERCGVTNTIIVKKEGAALCKRFKNQGLLFDKILVDAPCSGEGTLRSSFKTYSMWNLKTIKAINKIQKSLLSSAISILKVGGEVIYSTCTHAPEENEEVIDAVLREYGDKIKLEKIKLPIKTRQGLSTWQDKEYLEDIKYSCRVYPQDNNTEGFFLTKLRRIK